MKESWCTWHLRYQTNIVGVSYLSSCKDTFLYAVRRTACTGRASDPMPYAVRHIPSIKNSIPGSSVAIFVGSWSVLNVAATWWVNRFWLLTADNSYYCKQTYIFNRVKSESETSVDSNCSVDSDAAASDTRHDNRGAGVRGASGVRRCRDVVEDREQR